MTNLVVLNQKKLSEIICFGQILDFGLLHNAAAVKSVHDDCGTWIFTETPVDYETLSERLRGEEVQVFVDLDDSKTFSFFRLEKKGVRVISTSLIPERAWQSTNINLGEGRKGWLLDRKALLDSVSIKDGNDRIPLGRFHGMSIGFMEISVESEDVPDIFNGMDKIETLEINARSKEGLRRMMTQFLLSDTEVQFCRIHLDIDGNVHDKSWAEIMYDRAMGKSDIGCGTYAMTLLDLMYDRFIRKNYVRRNLSPMYVNGQKANVLGMTMEQFEKGEWKNDERYAEKKKNFTMDSFIAADSAYDSQDAHKKLKISYDDERKAYSINAEIREPGNYIFNNPDGVYAYNENLDGIYVPCFHIWKTNACMAFLLTVSFNNIFLDFGDGIHLDEEDKKNVSARQSMLHHVRPLFVKGGRYNMSEDVMSEDIDAELMLEDIDSEIEYLDECLRNTNRIEAALGIRTNSED